MDKQARINVAKEISLIKKDTKFTDGIMETYGYQNPRGFESHDGLIIIGEKSRLLFHGIIDKLWTKNKHLYYGITRKKILNEIIQLLKRDDIVSETDIKVLLKGIESEGQKEFWVYQEVLGAKLSKNEIVQLGPFKICHREIHVENLQMDSDFLRKKWNIIWTHEKPEILIGIKINVIEHKRAYELAAKYFREFENVLRFLINDSNKNRQIEIVYRPKFEPNTAISLSEDRHGFHSDIRLKGIQPVDLNHPFFTNNQGIVKKIFTIYDQKSSTDIDKRILTSIDWRGQALQEFDISKAFVMMMFAIEALLNHRSDGYIEPSILSKISESIAFICGTSLESRIQLEKDFKKLYSIRSQISHGAQTTVLESDFKRLDRLSNKLLLEFINNEELSGKKTILGVTEWIRSKKYSQ